MGPIDVLLGLLIIVIDVAVVASLTAVLDLAVAHEIDPCGHALPSAR